MVNLDEHSGGRQRFNGGPAGSKTLGKRKRGSSKNHVLLVVASLVFICCAFNLRLHLKATTGSYERWSEISDSSSDDSVHAARARAAVDGRSDDAKTKVPTWRPTSSTLGPTTTSFSTTIQNESTSSAPTAGDAAIKATKSSNEQDSIEGQVYDDDRSTSHPMMACFFQDDNEDDPIPNQNYMLGSSCSSLKSTKTRPVRHKPSIPTKHKYNKDAKVEEEEEVDVNEYGETDTCKYPDPSYQPTSTAPPTCNDIHSLGFDPGMFENQHIKSHRGSVKYITMGGAKCVWKATTQFENDVEESFIFKSHKDSRFLQRRFWDQNVVDALISGGAGNAQLVRKIESQNVDGISSTDSNWNHILPTYHYCALSNIVPLAEGTLVEYMNNGEKDRKRRRMKPVDTLRMALQVARGLYQAQLYYDGKPTFVHADVNPSQFLVFVPNSDANDNEAEQSKLPILQINDFNQGRFLTRSVENNEICPFKTCTKNLRGNRWHTPERFLECMEQDHRIDTFSLGSVFFFLLTNGFEPYYNSRNYMKPIKEGELPHIPYRLDLDHPAYDALKEVMEKCMAFKLLDRPSSLEVVHMLEEKLKKLELQPDDQV